eukprot:682603-Rhodomonas_salina.1
MCIRDSLILHPLTTPHSQVTQAQPHRLQSSTGSALYGFRVSGFGRQFRVWTAKSNAQRPQLVQIARTSRVLAIDFAGFGAVLARERYPAPPIPRAAPARTQFPLVAAHAGIKVNCHRLRTLCTRK